MNFENLLKKINIDINEFQFQFQSHPNYPSLLAFSDTLNFMGVKNDAYELEKEYWEELPEEFITIYNKNYVLVEKINRGFKLYSYKEETVSKEKLYQNSETFVMLFEKEEGIKEKSKINFRWLLYALFFIVLVYSAIEFSWYQVLYNALSVLGIFISLEVFNKKFGKESVVINNLCGASVGNRAQSSCTKIIDSDKINVLGLKFSDFSLIYFTGILVLGLFFPSTRFVLKVLSFFSIFVIVYSLLIQIFIEKTFCKICFAIISLLIGQIAIASLLFPFNFDMKVLSLSVLAFVVSLFAVIYINDMLKQKEDFKKSSLKNLKFKRNYDIFKKELLEKEISFKYTSSIFYLGNKNAKLHVSLVTNPYCGYCKDAHIILERLLKKYPEISAQVRFNYFPDTADENLTLLISAFKNIYESKGEKEFLTAIEFWYQNKDIDTFKQKYNLYLGLTNLSEVIILAEENKSNGITFTPAILINNYQYPNIYDREDIFYFIDELL